MSHNEHRLKIDRKEKVIYIDHTLPEHTIESFKRIYKGFVVQYRLPI